MRKSLFFAALAFPFLVACDDSIDLSIPEKAGPFGVDMGGTWTLQSINGVLPFAMAPNASAGTGATVTTTAPITCTLAANATASCNTNLVTAGTMTMVYNQEKDWEHYVSYRQTGVNFQGVQTSLSVRDSIRRGKYYSTTDATGLTAINLQVDNPYTGLYGSGRVTDNNTTLTHTGIAGGVNSVTQDQIWVWKKQ